MLRLKSQRGGVLLILLILIVLGGVLIGGYFIIQGTGFLPSADEPISPEKISYILPSPEPDEILSPSPKIIYQNPFEDDSYENPFDETYENPFNNL